MQSAFEGYELSKFKIDPKAKDPALNRNSWIQKIADLTEMKFFVIFGKTRHLPTSWIKDIYEDAMQAEGRVAKQKRCWWLINKTKV